MWLPVTLLLFVGVAVAQPPDHQHAWEQGNEYQYNIYSWTLAGLDRFKEHYTGLQLKGYLTIVVQSPEMLQAKFSNPQYAHVHKALPNGLEAEIPDQMLEYRPFPMSEKPFQIKLKHGVIRDLLVDRNVPTWELNILKGFVSQLQIDTQGENAIDSRSTQFPVNENSSVMFRAMEDSVGGKCEVLYDIMPLFDNFYEDQPDKIPFRYLRGDGQHYDVKKIKNYDKCKQRQVYHYGLNDPLNRNYKHNEILSQLSTTQMIISGNLKRFTLQSAIMKNQISVKPEKSNPFFGTVYSVTKLTLVKKGKPSNSNFAQVSNNLESTGNLVYRYNNPFSDSEHQREHRPSVSWNSAQMQSSESSSQNSDGDSSSNSYSSEEYNISNSVQPNAPLHLAPNVPLLPYYVGYMGKNIQSKWDIRSKIKDVYEKIKDLLERIFHGLKFPYVSWNQNMLEDFTILKNLLRIMNRKQYTELENYIQKEGKFFSQDKSYRNKWYVFRDAVTQAGTGPALLTIQNWLQNGKVEGVEAAKMISQIPKHVQEPTAEYINAFFDMLTDPRISQQKYVNVTAPLAFAELFRNSYSRQKYYPIYSFGYIPDNVYDEIAERYVSYLADQLKKAFLENDDLKIQTYIATLGVTGHPKMLSVFEPYIEGLKPLTKFQRFLMVTAMAYLIGTHPHLVGPIFYKLYLDTYEDHEIRCMAVQQFILTNPPLLTLQRIAEYTNFDTNEQVNSAVKTTLESLANLKRPHWQNLAAKARSVRHLLTPVRHDISYSLGYYKDIENWLLKGLALQTVGSDNNQMPKFLSLSLNTIFDYLGQPTLRTGYSVSNVQQLLDELTKLNLLQENEEMSEELPQNSRVEQLAQALNIKPQYLDKLEGNLFLDSLYGFQFYPFNSNTLRRIFRSVNNLLAENHKVESTSFNNYEMTLSFPTENGLPFISSVESPTVVKYQFEWKTEDSPNGKRSGFVNAIFANKIQRRFGFVAPFEHQNYIAGIDDNQVIHVPIEYEFEVDTNRRNFALKVRPHLPKNKTLPEIPLYHYSTVPFITRQDILDFQPVFHDKNTHQVWSSGQRATVERGAFSIQMEYDNKEAEKTLHNNFIAQYLNRQKYNDQYKKINVLLNTEQADGEISFNIAYDSTEVSANNDTGSNEGKVEVFPVESSKPNSADRRNQIMKGLSKGLNSGTVHVIDVAYSLPLFNIDQQVVTIGLVKSNLDKKLKTYVYWNSQLPSEETKQEVCYIHEIKFEPNTLLDFEYALKHARTNQLNAELLYGKDCKHGIKFVIVANATRSDKLTELIENSTVAKQCREEMKKGNKLGPSCLKAIRAAQMQDLYMISINQAMILEQFINHFVDLLSLLLPNVHMEVVNSSEANFITVKIETTPFNEVSKIHMHTPHMHIMYPYPETIVETQRLMSEVNAMLQNVVQPSCILDNNVITTFDKRMYPVMLGRTKHVLLTTYPHQDPDNYKHFMKIPEEMRAAVLAEDAEDGSKIIILYLNLDEIKLIKSNNHIQIVVNEKVINLSFNRNNRRYYYQHRDKDNQVIFEIEKILDGSINVYSDKFGIDLLYDGENVVIFAGDKYFNSLLGLCGNYDSDPNTDFITPKNCMLMKAEEFAATYALIEDNSQGPVVENKRKAERAQCQEMSSRHHYPRNVISDREAGRTMTENKNWGYHHDNFNMKPYGYKKYNLEVEDKPDHQDSQEASRNIVYRTKVVEEDGRTCFTVIPVPSCREDTKPMNRKSKKYYLHCLATNEESMALKNRVEQGANPDFSRKPATKTYVFQVPSLCILP